VENIQVAMEPKAWGEGVNARELVPLATEGRKNGCKKGGRGRGGEVKRREGKLGKRPESP